MTTGTNASPCNQLVFGAGLTGGFLLGALMHNGATVKAVGRSITRDKWSEGITLSDFNDNLVELSPPTFAQTGDAPADLVWLTVKCTATADVADDLRAYVGPTTTIVCCQNGFGSDAAIRAAFPDNPVSTAIVGFNVAEISDSHLRRATEGDFVIDAALAAQYGLNFGSKLMPLHISHDILASRWAKLQLNLANAVNALADVPVKTMLESRLYRQVIAHVMRELLAVTDAQNIKLPKVAAIPGKWMPFLMTLPDQLFQLIAQSMLAIDPTARTSMWWDLKNNRKTEIDYLNGAVIQAGQELGIPTPANQALVNLVKEVEAGRVNRGWSAKEFKTLILG